MIANGKEKAYRPTDRQDCERQTETEANRPTNRQEEVLQLEIQRKRQIDRQTKKRTEKQTGKRGCCTCSMKPKGNEKRGGQKDRNTEKQTHRFT